MCVISGVKTRQPPVNTDYTEYGLLPGTSSAALIYNLSSTSNFFSLLPNTERILTCVGCGTPND